MTEPCEGISRTVLWGAVESEQRPTAAGGYLPTGKATGWRIPRTYRSATCHRATTPVQSRPLQSPVGLAAVISRSRDAAGYHPYANDGSRGTLAADSEPHRLRRPACDLQR